MSQPPEVNTDVEHKVKSHKSHHIVYPHKLCIYSLLLVLSCTYWVWLTAGVESPDDSCILAFSQFQFNPVSLIA